MIYRGPWNLFSQLSHTNSYPSTRSHHLLLKKCLHETKVKNFYACFFNRKPEHRKSNRLKLKLNKSTLEIVFVFKIKIRSNSTVSFFNPFQYVKIGIEQIHFSMHLLPNFAENKNSIKFYNFRSNTLKKKRRKKLKSYESAAPRNVIIRNFEQTRRRSSSISSKLDKVASPSIFIIFFFDQKLKLLIVKI